MSIASAATACTKQFFIPGITRLAVSHGPDNTVGAKRKDSLSNQGVVERTVRRQGGVRAGLAVASYLIANDPMITPAESAITSQNK
jgi:hypothetical protein